MIAVECPQCGAPTPAFPLTPDRLACRACKYVGPPKADVLQQLRASAATLGAANAHEARHISAMHARGVASLLHARARLHRSLYILILPLGALGSCTLFATLADDPHYTVALIFSLPLALLAAAMIGGSLYLDAQTRKLADAVGAVPPATPGEPARCHLCGGALPPATNASPIVRCRHCSADNVASPELLHSIVRKRHASVSTFSRDVVSQASHIAIRSASAVTLVFLIGIAAPFVGCIGAMVIESALDDVELARLPAEYVFVRIEGQLCYAYVREKQDDGVWMLTASAPGITMTPVADAARYTRVDAKWFLRQRVRTGRTSSAEIGTIVDVGPHVLRPERNRARIRLDGSDDMTSKVIETLCTVDEPPHVVAFDWPVAPSKAKGTSPVGSASASGAASGDAAPGSAPTSPTARPDAPSSGATSNPKSESVEVPKSPR